MELLQDSGGVFSEAFGASDGSSPKMKRGILEWLRLYYGTEQRLQIPYTIVRKLVSGVFCEYDAPGLKALPQREAMELALICGESFLKPVPGGWKPISRGSILVFSRDMWGEPTDVGLMEKTALGRHKFTLLERRTLGLDGTLTITNRLFRSQGSGLGREVSLKSHPAYRELQARFVYPQTMDSVGLIRLKTPMTNCVDGRNEGVSIYAPAASLIAALEENESQLDSEFRNGQSRLVVSRDLLDAGQLKDTVFVALDESPENVGITVFSPQLRQESYLQRQQAYLRVVENIIGLRRGLLSSVEETDRTATEITCSEGDYMATLVALRQVWEEAVEKASRLQEALTGQPLDTQIAWGDGVL